MAIQDGGGCSVKIAICMLIVALCVTSCVSITPGQEQFYSFYMAERNKPDLGVRLIDEDDVLLASLFIPGLGHFMMDETGYAILWFFCGLVSPFSAPVAAVADCRTINRIRIADAYKNYLKPRK